MVKLKVKKGIILAAGVGSRLSPATDIDGKPLLPVFDKPMIYYPLATLISIGVQEVLIISNPRDLAHYRQLLHNGADLGISITHKIQAEPKGIPQAFTIGKDFIGNDAVALTFGDNLFFGEDLNQFLEEQVVPEGGCTIFTQRVENPQDFGILERDANGTPIGIEEKPENPKSNEAVTGLYFFGAKSGISEVAEGLEASERGETEITDALRYYLEKQKMSAQELPDSTLWHDTGTPKSLLLAAQMVASYQDYYGTLVGSPELAAFEAGLITSNQLLKLLPAQKDGTSSEEYVNKLNSYHRVLYDAAHGLNG